MIQYPVARFSISEEILSPLLNKDENGRCIPPRAMPVFGSRKRGSKMARTGCLRVAQSSEPSIAISRLWIYGESSYSVWLTQRAKHITMPIVDAI